MARLRSLIAAGLFALAAPAGAQVHRWEAEISEASARFNIPEEWIRRTMKAESGGRTEVMGAPIVSRTGAMGLMQLMPGTWLEMRSAYRLGSDPFDPHDNIIAGVAYLKAMYDRFGYPGLFAAYNAGPQRFARALDGRAELPPETRRYVRRLAGAGVPARKSSGAEAQNARAVAPTIFAINRETAGAGPSRNSQAGPLLVISTVTGPPER